MIFPTSPVNSPDTHLQRLKQHSPSKKIDADKPLHKISPRRDSPERTPNLDEVQQMFSLMMLLRTIAAHFLLFTRNMHQYYLSVLLPLLFAKTYPLVASYFTPIIIIDMAWDAFWFAWAYGLYSKHFTNIITNRWRVFSLITLAIGTSVIHCVEFNIVVFRWNIAARMPAALRLIVASATIYALTPECTLNKRIYMYILAQVFTPDIMSISH